MPSLIFFALSKLFSTLRCLCAQAGLYHLVSLPPASLSSAHGQVRPWEASAGDQTVGGGRCGSIYCPGPQLCVALALAGISTCSWLSCMAPRGGSHQESSSPGSITPLTPTPFLLQAFANFCQLLPSIASFCNFHTVSSPVTKLSSGNPLDAPLSVSCQGPDWHRKGVQSSAGGGARVPIGIYSTLLSPHPLQCQGTLTQPSKPHLQHHFLQEALPEP